MQICAASVVKPGMLQPQPQCQLKAEKMQTVFTIAAAVAQIVAILCGIGAYYASTRKHPEPPPSPEQIAAAVKQALKESWEGIRFSDQSETEKYPGLSMNYVIRFHRIAEQRRKYVFDMGSDQNGRYSLYFDAQNILTFSLTDLHGETYTVRIPTTTTGIPFDQFIFLTCEVAFRSQSTLLRVSVNATDIGQINIPTRIESPVSLVGLTLGADINGRNGAAFDFIENVIYTSTLTSVEKAGCVTFYSQQKFNQCSVFDGSKWMRRNLAGALEQPDASLAPKFIKL